LQPIYTRYGLVKPQLKAKTEHHFFDNLLFNQISNNFPMGYSALQRDTLFRQKKLENFNISVTDSDRFIFEAFLSDIATFSTKDHYHYLQNFERKRPPHDLVFRAKLRRNILGTKWHEMVNFYIHMFYFNRESIYKGIENELILKHMNSQNSLYGSPKIVVDYFLSERIKDVYEADLRVLEKNSLFYKKYLSHLELDDEPLISSKFHSFQLAAPAKIFYSFLKFSKRIHSPLINFFPNPFRKHYFLILDNDLKHFAKFNSPFFVKSYYGKLKNKLFKLQTKEDSYFLQQSLQLANRRSPQIHYDEKKKFYTMQKTKNTQENSLNVLDDKSIDILQDDKALYELFEEKLVKLSRIQKNRYAFINFPKYYSHFQFSERPKELTKSNKISQENLSLESQFGKPLLFDSSFLKILVQPIRQNSYFSILRPDDPKFRINFYDVNGKTLNDTATQRFHDFNGFYFRERRNSLKRKLKSLFVPRNLPFSLNDYLLQKEELFKNEQILIDNNSEKDLLVEQKSQFKGWGAPDWKEKRLEQTKIYRAKHAEINEKIKKDMALYRELELKKRKIFEKEKPVKELRLEPSKSSTQVEVRGSLTLPAEELQARDELEGLRAVLDNYGEFLSEKHKKKMLMEEKMLIKMLRLSKELVAEPARRKVVLQKMRQKLHVSMESRKAVESQKILQEITEPQEIIKPEETARLQEIFTRVVVQKIFSVEDIIEREKIIKHLEMLAKVSNLRYRSILLPSFLRELGKHLKSKEIKESKKILKSEEILQPKEILRLQQIVDLLGVTKPKEIAKPKETVGLQALYKRELAKPKSILQNQALDAKIEALKKAANDPAHRKAVLDSFKNNEGKKLQEAQSEEKKRRDELLKKFSADPSFRKSFLDSVKKKGALELQEAVKREEKELKKFNKSDVRDSILKANKPVGVLDASVAPEKENMSEKLAALKKFQHNLVSRRSVSSGNFLEQMSGEQSKLIDQQTSLLLDMRKALQAEEILLKQNEERSKVLHHELKKSVLEYRE